MNSTFTIDDAVYISTRSNSSLVAMICNDMHAHDAFDILLSRAPIEDDLVVQLPHLYFERYIAYFYRSAHYYTSRAYVIALRANRPDLLSTIYFCETGTIPHKRICANLYGLQEAIMRRDYVSLRRFASNGVAWINSFNYTTLTRLSVLDLDRVLQYVSICDPIKVLRHLAILRKPFPRTWVWKWPIVKEISTYKRKHQLRVLDQILPDSLDTLTAAHASQFAQMRISIRKTIWYEQFMYVVDLMNGRHGMPLDENDLLILYDNDALHLIDEYNYTTYVNASEYIGPYYAQKYFQ